MCWGAVRNARGSRVSISGFDGLRKHSGNAEQHSGNAEERSGNIQGMPRNVRGTFKNAKERSGKVVEALDYAGSTPVTIHRLGIGYWHSVSHE
jgi:hypothetical protein